MKKAFVVAGLQFGDEGKGTIVDALVRRYESSLVVRYGGGPQCAHHVVTNDGVSHCFSQFGAGTMAGARTFLGPNMLIEPFALMGEADVLKQKGVCEPLELISVDGTCAVITPWQKLANRIRETIRGAARHGSVGAGVGETRADQKAGVSLSINDILAGNVQAARDIRSRKLANLAFDRGAAPEPYELMKSIGAEDLFDQYRQVVCAVKIEPWSDVFPHHDSVVFEGHQGVLLDQDIGFAPHRTYSDCTFREADVLLKSANCREVRRLGVTRSYTTRHGAGPFPTEDATLVAPELHNSAHPWMGKFRVGHMDAVLLRYAVDRCPGIDALAVTHLDAMPSRKICTSYERGGTESANQLALAVPAYSEVDESLVDLAARLTGIPVDIASYGPLASDKHFLKQSIAARGMN